MHSFLAFLSQEASLGHSSQSIFKGFSPAALLLSLLCMFIPLVTLKPHYHQGVNLRVSDK